MLAEQKSPNQGFTEEAAWRLLEGTSVLPTTLLTVHSCFLEELGVLTQRMGTRV